MKRVFFVVGLFLINSISAQTRFTVDDLTYETINSSEVRVIDCVDTLEVVVIPSTVSYDENTYNVTMIYGWHNGSGCFYGAFRGMSNLTSVTIPESVTYIGEEAFCFCEALDSIIIPKSVDSIGERAFYSCSSLRYISVGDGVVSIAIQAFQYCHALNELYLGESLSTIGAWAFEYCYNLASVTIPENVTYIGNLAFAFCNNLTEVISLPETPPMIGLDVFNIVGNPESGISDTALLKVPCGSLTAYTNSNFNQYFGRVKEMCSDVGIAEANTINFSFYPNPTNGIVIFDNAVERVEIIDSGGKILRIFSQVEQIDITNLPVGLYYIRLKIGEEILIKKVIKK